MYWLLGFAMLLSVISLWIGWADVLLFFLPVIVVMGLRIHHARDLDRRRWAERLAIPVGIWLFGAIVTLSRLIV